MYGLMLNVLAPVGKLMHDFGSIALVHDPMIFDARLYIISNGLHPFEGEGDIFGASAQRIEWYSSTMVFNTVNIATDHVLLLLMRYILPFVPYTGVRLAVLE